MAAHRDNVRFYPRNSQKLTGTGRHAEAQPVYRALCDDIQGYLNAGGDEARSSYTTRTEWAITWISVASSRLCKLQLTVDKLCGTGPKY